MTCPKHPKYKGKKIPVNECSQCLEFYLSLQKPRVTHRPTRTMRNKKLYSRKNKFRCLAED